MTIIEEIIPAGHVVRDSLETTVDDYILVAKQKYYWQYEHIDGVRLYYLSL